MVGARIFGWLLGAGVVAGALTLGCTYSPDFRGGSLKCSADGQCPSGYACTRQYCCRPGDASCGAGSDAGAGGDAGAGVNTAAYLGTWSFTSATTLDTECEGAGSSGGPAAFLTSQNPTSTLAITDNGNGTLKAAWSEWTGCTYTLSVDSAGAHGSDADTWACEQMYTPAQTSPPQITDQLWIYDSFDILTADGRTATHDGVYFRQDTYSDKSVVYCTQTLHAPLTKQ